MLRILFVVGALALVPALASTTHPAEDLLARGHADEAISVLHAQLVLLAGVHLGNVGLRNIYENTQRLNLRDPEHLL